jgi:16S rRNA (cytosine1402-N4)-methyltransferase
VAEVVELLRGADLVVDATLGAGGHAEALLAAGVPRVLGIDRDPDALVEARGSLERFGERFVAMERRFSELDAAARDAGVEHAGGVLFDLGISSMQLDRVERGFSFRAAGPLDMRMGSAGPTAADIVNTYREEELARVLYEFGEERMSRPIAAAIVRARSRKAIATTDELAAIVAHAVPRRKGRGHPARRTFQALRIAVNAELEEVAASLPRATDLLEPGGVVAVISYHSLEDRIVKRYFVGEDRLRTLTKKPIGPSAAEAARNPRSRSAKLRAARRDGVGRLAA